MLVHTEDKAVRLHLACGNIFLSDWINIDYESTMPGVVKCDLTKGIPFKDESVDEILASHFLEHLKLRHEAIPFLQECYRVLKRGGIMSFITPNFEVIYKTYDPRGMSSLAAATFGDGRTGWDYHTSGWWPERFKQLAEKGHIYTPGAPGGAYRVWNEGVEVIHMFTLWRPHSPYEVTAIFRKPGGTEATYPTWMKRTEIVGNGFLTPLRWRYKYSIKPIVVGIINRFPIIANPLRSIYHHIQK